MQGLPSEALFWKNPPLTHRSPSTKYFCKTADCDRLHSVHQLFPPPKSFNFQCFQSADRTCITTILKFILYSQGLFIYIHPPLPKIYKLLAWYFISILHLVAITPLKYCAKLNNKKNILQLIQINTNITYSGSVKPIVIFWTLFEAIYAPKSQHIKYKCLYNNTV